jgi:2-polyprenyl-6-methoxyphenol hydroxylase-like FAD-dependent oxidoreductase
MTLPLPSQEPVSAAAEALATVRDGPDPAHPTVFHDAVDALAAAVERAERERDEAREALEQYHERCRERDALAVQLAQSWDWPAEPHAVLGRLTGDRTAALTTFSEEAVATYLGVASPAEGEEL